MNAVNCLMAFFNESFDMLFFNGGFHLSGTGEMLTQTRQRRGAPPHPDVIEIGLFTRVIRPSHCLLFLGGCMTLNSGLPFGTARKSPASIMEVESYEGVEWPHLPLNSLTSPILGNMTELSA